MSAFVTPSRTPSSAAAAAVKGHSGSGGKSSSRRVVRSALETLMDTTSPELVGLRSAGGSSVKRPAAVPTSSFSVTYTTAPAATSTPLPAHATMRSALTGEPSAAVAAAPASVRSATMACSRAEPSALDFLSPHSKAAREVPYELRPSAGSRRPHRHRGRPHASSSGMMVRPPSEHPPHRQTDRGAALCGKDASDDEQANADLDGEAHTAPPRFAAAALAPASPSRSLYADVEAARLSVPPVLHTPDMLSFSPTPTSLSPSPAVKSRRQGSSAAEKVRRWEEKAEDGDGEDEAAALVTHAEMAAVVAAALHRYEKERDAEEEAVLQQVSKEVEEQASRYANLAEAYDTVCAERETLQEKLTDAAKESEELRHALQKARQAQQAQKDSMKRLEVELYHARDAQQQQQTLVKVDAAEWEAQRACYEKRQDTLESQLDQARKELREANARIAEQDEELAALRERAAKASAETEDEYADIHLRVRQLAQNMASMEGALRERDATIAEQAARLSEATGQREAEVRVLTAEREKAEAALTSVRDALQRQTDDIRRRMHRVTHLQQQRDTFKEEVKAARHALQAASEDQGRVLQSIRDVLANAKARLYSVAGGAGGGRLMLPARSPRSPHKHSAHRLEEHMNSTLVYEDGHEDHTNELGSCSTASQSGSRSGSTMRTMELSSSEDDDNGQHGRLFFPSTVTAKGEHRSASSPKSRTHRTSPPPSSASPGQRRARTLSPPPTCAAVQGAPAREVADSSAVGHVSHQLRHQSSQALLLLRELHRCVSSLTSQKRKPSPGADVAHSRTSGRIGRSAMTAARLEQACRYLKSELDRSREALKVAQDECQWRALSMKKWEEDVQAARGDVLAAEKQRLACEAQVETASLVREELEAQLTELRETCAAATAEQRAAENAVAEAKATAERSAALAEEAARLKEAAELSLAKEQAKSARQATALRDQAAVQTALTGELVELKEKHKSALAQLQTYHAREAAQLLRQQQEESPRRREAELAELRSIVETWKAERASLQALVASLETKLRALTVTAATAKRRCVALEEQLALHADVERSTLKTIGDIVGGPPIPLTTDAAVVGDGADTLHPHGAVLSTEKQLFGGDDETVEVEVVVVPAEASPSGSGAYNKLANAASHTRTATGRTTALSLVSARLPTTSATPAKVASSKVVSSASPASTPSLSDAFSKTTTSSPVSTLAPLRQHIVAAVQQLALEVVRLRQGVVLPSVQSQTVAQPRTASCRPCGVAASEVWYSGEAARDGVGNDPPVQSSQMWGSGDDMKRSPTPALSSPPPLEAFTALQPQPPPQQQHRPPRTSHMQRPFSGSGIQARTSPEVPPSRQRRDHGLSGSPPTPPQPPPYATTRSHSESCSPPVPAATAPAVDEHIYNVSPWSRLRPQWSPSSSLSPPVSHAAAATYSKQWHEAPRSASMRDGLSGYSNSAGRGSVDGSCTPARPPSLRALSLPR
ncbi:hypothetical protein GH5_07733 [Leishmania sp. Ghana 2012 LV757]|uniref:hypothetical protein n=1 Tax=Leishmania sp. Ghana 2012 LV757 TaxID=2803181 RepID=UPI001B740586|nr:hypothetical protein GH5_07733 [Leishmania sp. Ghana 2012 LV757]